MKYDINDFECEAKAITLKGKIVGRIVSRWTRSGTCITLVQFWDARPEHAYKSGWGSAGGYGYDKRSASISDAIHKMGLGLTHDQMQMVVFRNYSHDHSRAFNDKWGEIIKGINGAMDEETLKVYREEREEASRKDKEANEAMEKKIKAQERKIFKSGKIPVYSGAGNEKEAFRIAGYELVSIL